MSGKLCPINSNLHYHGGLCIREQCEWWVTGTERSDLVRDTYSEECSDRSEQLQGPYGGACAIKALAVEAHDIDVRLRHLDHDITCITKAIRDGLENMGNKMTELVDATANPNP